MPNVPLLVPSADLVAIQYGYASETAMTQEILGDQAASLLRDQLAGCREEQEKFFEDEVAEAPAGSAKPQYPMWQASRGLYHALLLKASEAANPYDEDPVLSNQLRQLVSGRL